MDTNGNKYLKFIHDPKLVEKTGKSWAEWFAFLDRFQAMGLGQKELLKLLKRNFKLSPSWQQALVIAWENEKKGNERTLSASEYQVQAARVFNLPLPSLNNLWSDVKLRNTWFPVITCCILRENPKRTVRLLWPDSISLVELRFSRVDKSKSSLEIVHTHLPSPKSAAEMEVYWNKVLQQLEESVTSDQFHSVILDI